ncbi:hypothetical protein B0O80DRAFT_507073, partial [Mortierella sp. GBAus27b]
QSLLLLCVPFSSDALNPAPSHPIVSHPSFLFRVSPPSFLLFHVSPPSFLFHISSIMREYKCTFNQCREPGLINDYRHNWRYHSDDPLEFDCLFTGSKLCILRSPKFDMMYACHCKKGTQENNHRTVVTTLGNMGDRIGALECTIQDVKGSIEEVNKSIQSLVDVLFFLDERAPAQPALHAPSQPSLQAPPAPPAWPTLQAPPTRPIP